MDTEELLSNNYTAWFLEVSIKIDFNADTWLQREVYDCTGLLPRPLLLHWHATVRTCCYKLLLVLAASLLF